MFRPSLLCAAALSLALAACDRGAPEVDAEGVPNAAEPREAALTPQGWGPIRIGMTSEQLALAVGALDDTGDFGECVEGRPANGPEHLLVMTEQGVVTRVSAIRDSELRTDAGFGIGDTAAEIKAALGDQARVEPHKYEGPPAEYITVWSGEAPDGYVQNSAARGVVYEIGGEGTVQAIHAGGPSIQYVEGCA